jgi:hypothetical protein|tara:strand:- start:393 stop:1139 length:747 start_codon:yes stop_codon:yes gene_type:complete
MLRFVDLEGPSLPEEEPVNPSAKDGGITRLPNFEQGPAQGPNSPIRWYPKDSGPANRGFYGPERAELPGKLGSEVGQLAMSREQARGLLDNFTKEALRGNITPETFGSGLFESQMYGVSPDQGRRVIRNTLKNPMARMMAENSGLAKEFAKAGLGGLEALGVNPQTANKYLGLGGTLLDQARKDGLLKQDVTVEEVAEHFQRPLYGALQDYIRDNKNNPEIEALLRKAYPDAKMPGRTLLEGLLNELN